MKKRIIIIGVVAMLVIAAIVAVVLVKAFTSEGVVVNSGVSSGYSTYVKNNTWSTTADKINGHCRVDITFDSDNLAVFRANATNSSGKVFLKLIQDEVENAIDITGEFNDKLDMGDFKPGRIRLRLEFEESENVHVVINW